VTSRWEEPPFLTEAVGWIDDQLHVLGRSRVGGVEQPHVRTWATALRVPALVARYLARYAPDRTSCATPYLPRFGSAGSAGR
jgi:hypothetical protein